MNKEQKQQLQKMIEVNSVQDNTELIRESKNSEKIISDIQTMMILKKRHGSLSNDSAEKQELFEKECSFLYNNFKYLYEKIYKDQLDLHILNYMLQILAKIETHELDQHTASFEIGKFLKEVYVDTAIYDDKKEVKQIKWGDYKLITNFKNN